MAKETKEIPVLGIKKQQEDARYEFEDYNNIKLFAYLNPEKIKSVESRLINNPISQRTISTNREIPYVKIFTEELLLIPVFLEFTIPVGYELVINPDNDLVMKKGLTIISNSLFYTDNKAFIIVANYADTTKNISHNELLVIGKLSKTQIFDIETIN